MVLADLQGVRCHEIIQILQVRLMMKNMSNDVVKARAQKSQ
jgi:hypothetical protein